MRGTGFLRPSEEFTFTIPLHRIPGDHGRRLQRPHVQLCGFLGPGRGGGGVPHQAGSCGPRGGRGHESAGRRHGGGHRHLFCRAFCDGSGGPSHGSGALSGGTTPTLYGEKMKAYPAKRRPAACGSRRLPEQPGGVRHPVRRGQHSGNKVEGDCPDCQNAVR